LNNELIIFPKEIAPENYEELYRMVVDQLSKDFHPYASLENIPQELSAEWIFEEIKRMLSIIIPRESSALGYIIYRVDITEKTMRKAMHGLAGEEKLNALAHLILKREAQKVWIRQQFSQGS